MSESTPAAGARAATLGFPSAPGAGDAAEPPRAGTPNPRGSFAGRASEFRQRGAHRRFRRLELLAEIGCVALIVVAFTVVLTAKPPPTPSPGTPPWEPAPSSAPITVRFGTPTVGNVSCGAGGTAYTERIPWLNSSRAGHHGVDMGDPPRTRGRRLHPGPERSRQRDPGERVCRGSSVALRPLVCRAGGAERHEPPYLYRAGRLGVRDPRVDGPPDRGQLLPGGRDGRLDRRHRRGLAVLGYVGTASISGNVPL